MNNNVLFEQLVERFRKELTILNDKPEETIESTIKAIWEMACGIPLSAEKAALQQTLPELRTEQIDKLNYLIDRRLNNIPLAHLTGRQSFMGIEFLCDKRALIPRKETEVLGNTALQLTQNFSINKKKVKVIDICCGGGNLGLAIAYLNPNAQVFASDISQDAVDLTLDNVSFLNLLERVQIEQSDLFSSYESEQFYNKTDVIICNPPYISTAKVGKMEAEIAANEPAIAFDGGMLGFKIFQRLISEAPKFLTIGGWLVFEVGLGQGEFIMQLCYKTGKYSSIMPVNDELGNIRCIAVQK